jgi:heat shock protein HslJ
MKWSWHVIAFSFLGICAAACAQDGIIDLDSITFHSSRASSGTVTLSHGEYREAIVPGSTAELVVKLTERRATGVVNGIQTAGVILVTDTGGSGMFYDLALLSKGSEGWNHIDTVFLGDRVKIHSVELQGREMIIDMTTQGPQDAMCCPTREVKKRFAVQAGRLVVVDEKSTDLEPAGIIGPVWQWEGTLSNDGKKVVPADQKNYTVQLSKDGTLAIKADCNAKGGSFSIAEGKLSITITHSTLAACPEGSLEDQFVHDLTGAARVFNSDARSLDLHYDSWMMKFSRQNGPT